MSACTGNCHRHPPNCPKCWKCSDHCDCQDTPWAAKGISLDRYDPAASRQARDQGLEQVESHNEGWMERAREAAYRHCLAHGAVTADLVRNSMGSQDAPGHPNAWGSVFRDPRFEKVPGAEHRSGTVSRHAGHQYVWRLKGRAPGGRVPPRA